MNGIVGQEENMLLNIVSIILFLKYNFDEINPFSCKIRIMLQAEKRKLEAEDMYASGTSYTNSNNPFNDPNLTSTFVWSKKLAVEGQASLSIEEIEKLLVLYAVIRMKIFYM